MPVRNVPPLSLEELDILEKAADHTTNVTTGSLQVLAPNKHRTYALFINDSDTIIYLRQGPGALVNTGIRLNAAGGSFEINKDTLYKGAVSAIHGGAGNKVLCITELETRYAP